MTKENKNKSKVIPNKVLVESIEDAISKIKEYSQDKKRNFTESVDLAINLGIDSKQTNQTVKGSVLLPNGSGKNVKVIVFSDNEDEQKLALELGAKHAGLDDLITKISNGFLDFDRCIATPTAMSKISKIAKKLGPRGLMPSPKNGSVTTDIKKAVSEALKGRVDFKNDKSGTVHCLVGKINFENNQLVQNTQSLIKTIRELKPESTKGKFIKEVFLSTTMGPSIQINISAI